MTGNLESLLEAMKAQAEKDKAACLAEADEKVRAINAETDTAIEALRTNGETALTGDIQTESRRVLGESRLYRYRKILETRRARADEALRQARTRLEHLIREGGHRPALKQLILDTAEALGDGARIEISSADGEVITEQLTDVCEIRAGDFPPGTVVGTSRDGLRRIDNSLLRRLESIARLLAADVAQLLFGGTREAVAAP